MNQGSSHDKYSKAPKLTFNSKRNSHPAKTAGQHLTQIGKAKEEHQPKENEQTEKWVLRMFI